MDSISEKIWTGAAGGLFVVLAKLGIDYVISVFRNPKLAIDYRNTATGYRVATDAWGRIGTDAGEKNITYKALCVSVSVTNERGQTAKNCRGFLVGIDAFEDGRFQPTDYCDSIPLAWAYRLDEDARKGVDIPKSVTQFLNVFICCEPSVGTGFQPCTVPKTMRKATERFKLPGEFRFKIQISADNVETQLYGLRVTWNDDWRTIWDSNNNCEKLTVVPDATVRDAW